MSKNGKKRALGPRLRFPEFRDDRVWEQKPLSALTVPVGERVGDSDCVPYTVTSGEGLVSQEEKYGRTIAGKSLKNYYRLQRDDFAFNKSATKVFPQGYIARFQGDERAAVPNSIFTCFRIANENVDAAYLDYLFQGNLHGRWLKNYIMVGARAHGALNISDDDLYALPVPLPAGNKSLAEQQKIAACLGSLDDLITAEGRKLTALRDHKKGLMQQLFPREGETRPRLRFPDFLKDVSSFEQVAKFAKVTTGNKDTQNKVDKGQYPFFVRSQNVERIDSYSYDGEAVLTSGDGVGVGENYHYINGRFDFHQRVYCIYEFSSKVDGRYFFHYFSQHFKKRVKQMSAKNSVDSVRMAMITEMSIRLPKIEEQKRIADCLSALDALNLAQAEKLDALRTHKRGLMQQLFPAPEDAGV